MCFAAAVDEWVPAAWHGPRRRRLYWCFAPHTIHDRLNHFKMQTPTRHPISPPKPRLFALFFVILSSSMRIFGF
jgi:hypothetical protein